VIKQRREGRGVYIRSYGQLTVMMPFSYERENLFSTISLFIINNPLILVFSCYCVCIFLNVCLCCCCDCCFLLFSFFNRGVLSTPTF